MKLAMVDIDSTLWDFGTEMVNRMRLAFPNKDIPEEFDTWEDPLKYFDNPYDVLDLFRGIHSEQYSFEPYPLAKEMLMKLSKTYLIHVASNRDYSTISSTRIFMTSNDLYYDDLFCSTDKRELFKQFKYDLVIDDSPQVQEAAIERNIPVWTLTYPYNKHITETKKFGSVTDIYNHIK
jgi:hypothetical protein